MAVAVIVLLRVNESELVRSSFVIDHLIKFALFGFTLECGPQLLCGLERLAGYDTQPLIRHMFLSRTVAEFWVRYNNRVQSWLAEHVYRHLSTRPALGVWAVFLFSGLFHELMFDIATSHIDGYQLAFFLLQAPAVLHEEAAQRRSHRKRVAGPERAKRSATEGAECPSSEKASGSL